MVPEDSEGRHLAEMMITLPSREYTEIYVLFLAVCVAIEDPQKSVTDAVGAPRKATQLSKPASGRA